MNNGVEVMPENSKNGHRSLASAVTEYLEETKLTRKPKTHAAYSKALAYFRESCHKLFLHEIERRDLLKLGASAAVAPAALAQQHPQPTTQPVNIATQKSWTPQLFDAHQNETVVALTERIIPATDTPGAKAAFVNRCLDRLLHDIENFQEPERWDGMS